MTLVSTTCRAPRSEYPWLGSRPVVPMVLAAATPAELPTNLGAIHRSQAASPLGLRIARRLSQRASADVVGHVVHDGSQRDGDERAEDAAQDGDCRDRHQ